jgi:hypothetical protein
MLGYQRKNEVEISREIGVNVVPNGEYALA